MTGNAIQATVPMGISVQRRAGCYIGDACMTLCAGGLVYPWQPGIGDRVSDFCHGPVAGLTISVHIRVSVASHAFCDRPRVAVVAGGVSCRMGTVNGGREIFP